MERRKSREVNVGGVKIGGNAPISVQSMTNTPTADRVSTLAQIKALADAGCDVVRVTVNTPEAAEAVGYLCAHAPVPLVADIHFDYRLALAAAEAGVAKLRINPGNIGSEEGVRAVAELCRKKGIPVRIGINGGSLERELLAKYGGPVPEALCESALKAAEAFERYGLDKLVLSVKCSSVPDMIRANRLLAERCDYPLHLGVTETGTLRGGSVKSAVGIGSLLCDGIGDTVRVSLTADPVEEVRAAKEILKACGRSGGVNLISCPTCGRTQVDLIRYANALQERIDRLAVRTGKTVTVALMGCAVNGPGEAREADVGVACGKGEGLLFRKGVTVRKLTEEEILPTLWTELLALLEQGEADG